MLHRIFALPQSGGKNWLLQPAKKAYEDGKSVYFLVPEQITAEYERDLVALCGAESCFRAQVCNFSRLPDLVLPDAALAQTGRTEEEKKLLLFACLRE